MKHVDHWSVSEKVVSGHFHIVGCYRTFGVNATLLSATYHFELWAAHAGSGKRRFNIQTSIVSEQFAKGQIEPRGYEQQNFILPSTYSSADSLMEPEFKICRNWEMWMHPAMSPRSLRVW